MTADMGALRFYSGSHKLGHLGNLMDQQVWNQWTPMIERRSRLSDPVVLQPGDATIHNNATIHGAPANSSGRTRWSWASVMAPGDLRYTGATNFLTDGYDFVPNGQLDHPRFPIIYSPE